MKKQNTPCISLSDAQKEVVVRDFRCQECEGRLKAVIKFAALMFRCNDCGELYCVSVAENDIIWLRYTVPRKLYQQSAIVYWRQEDDTFARKRPPRRRTTVSADNGDSGGNITESLAALETASTETLGDLQELAKQQARRKLIHNMEQADGRLVRADIGVLSLNRVVETTKSFPENLTFEEIADDLVTALFGVEGRCTYIKLHYKSARRKKMRLS
jgi:hypothetical protein